MARSWRWLRDFEIRVGRDDGSPERCQHALSRLATDGRLVLKDATPPQRAHRHAVAGYDSSIDEHVLLSTPKGATHWVRQRRGELRRVRGGRHGVTAARKSG